MAKIRDIQDTADWGRVLVDEQLQELESRLTGLYARASHEMKQELNDFLSFYAAKDADMRRKLNNDEISKADYEDWRERTIWRTEAMSAEIADLTQTMLKADQEAMAMVNRELPQVYATSWNFGGYRGAVYGEAAGFDYAPFTIYNADAIRILATSDPDLLPYNPKVDIPKDERWNMGHIQSALAQSIVQGDSVNDMADRLQQVATMDRNAAVRTARTAFTGVENRARLEATKEIIDSGIPMEIVWSCTHDGRTRESHILLDYTSPDEDGLFGNGLEYPADPNGEPEEVYNCRCSLLTFIKGIDHSKDSEIFAKIMEGEDYDNWVAINEKAQGNEVIYQQKRAKALERQAAINKADEKAKAQEKADNKPAYPTASNRAEAIQLLKDMGFSKVSSGVDKIEEKAFVDTVNRLSELNTKYNAIDSGMEFKTGKMKSCAYIARDHLHTTDCKLSTNYFNNNTTQIFARVVPSQIEAKWWMPATADYYNTSIITHEYGHILENSIIHNSAVYQAEINKKDQMRESIWHVYLGQTFDNEASNIRKEIIQIARANNENFSLTDNISEYGRTNAQEFFAEVFMNAHCGAPNELGKAMQEWLRGKGYAN